MNIIYKKRHQKLMMSACRKKLDYKFYTLADVEKWS